MNKLRLTVFIVLISLIVSGTMAVFSRQVSGRDATAKPTAYIEAVNMNLAFKMGGKISEIVVEEGENVKKGQVLARLESKEYENKVAQAEAAVLLAEGKMAEATGAKEVARVKENQGSQAVIITKESLESQIEQAKAAVIAAEANVDALEAKLSTLKELYDIALANYDRMTALQNDGGVAQIQVDEAKAKLEQAKAEFLATQEQKKAAIAQVQQANANLSYVRANQRKVDVSKKDVEAAQAAVTQASGAVQSAIAGKNQAEAALEEAKTYLSYTELIAPADGIILTQSAQLGEIVNAGFPIFSMETNDTRYAQFYFDETDVLDLEIGNAVIVELIASGKQLNGEIKMISHAPDFAIKKATQSIGETDIRSFSVKVEFPQLSSTIPSGMTVQWVGKGETE